MTLIVITHLMMIICPLAKVSCSLLVASYGAITVASSSFFPDLSWCKNHFIYLSTTTCKEHETGIVWDQKYTFFSFLSFLEALAAFCMRGNRKVF